MNKKTIYIVIAIVIVIILIWGYKTQGWFGGTKKYKVDIAFTASKPKNGNISGPTKDFHSGDTIVVHKEKDIRGNLVWVTSDGWDVTGYITDMTKL